MGKGRGYGECPVCGHDCWQDVSDGMEPHMLDTKDFRVSEGIYGTQQDWTEVWKCPKCNTQFEERNGCP